MGNSWRSWGERSNREDFYGARIAFNNFRIDERRGELRRADTPTSIDLKAFDLIRSAAVFTNRGGTDHQDRYVAATARFAMTRIRLAR